MYLRVTHSMFVKTNPDITIRFPALSKFKPKNFLLLKDTPNQLTFTCSKSTIKILEKDMKYVQSYL